MNFGKAVNYLMIFFLFFFNLSYSVNPELEKKFLESSPLGFSDAHKTLQIVDKRNNKYTLIPCKKYAEAHGEQVIGDGKIKKFASQFTKEDLKYCFQDITELSDNPVLRFQELLIEDYSENKIFFLRNNCGSIVAFLGILPYLCKKHGNLIWLSIAVLPSHKGQGIANKLVDLTKKYFSNKDSRVGMDGLYISYYKKNTPMKKIAKNNGFILLDKENCSSSDEDRDRRFKGDFNWLTLLNIAEEDYEMEESILNLGPSLLTPTCKDSSYERRDPKNDPGSGPSAPRGFAF